MHQNYEFNRIMYMNKKIIAIVIGVVLVGGAGTTYFFVSGNSAESGRAGLEESRRIGNQTGGRELSVNATPASAEDLHVGENITVMGTSNADGSMTASTIYIGTVAFEQGQLDGNSEAEQAFADRQPPEGFTPPEGVNPQELQNLSPEERQARFAELQESGAFPEGGFTGGGAGARSGGGFRGGNMVRGEILNIDDMTITIALSDGGSRLVFYSSQTTISKISDPD